MCDDATIRAGKNQLELELNCPTGLPQVTADPNRLEDVLHNLCDNAVKYTDPGGRICVLARKCTCEVAQSGSDTGCRVPAEMRDEVFREFVRASEPEYADRDRGLGP